MARVADVYRIEWSEGRLGVAPIEGVDVRGFVMEVTVPVHRALGPYRRDVELWLRRLDTAYDVDDGWASRDDRSQWNTDRQRLEREVNTWLRPRAVVELPRDPAVTVLRLMNDYGVDFPIWAPPGVTEPAADDLTDELVRDLVAWGQVWEDHHRPNDDVYLPLPPSFRREGRRLQRQIERQLGQTSRSTCTPTEPDSW